MSKETNNRFYLPLLAFLSAFLLWLGWPVKPLAFVLFIGWVPFLLLEKAISEKTAPKRGRTFFKYAYLTLLLWNIFTTYWVSYSTLGGGIAAVVFNALFMMMPMMAFFWTKRAAGRAIGYLSLPIYWIAFEQFHLNWDLSWPWLTLGNGFASLPSWVQWYEYTGYLGGSVWVWAVNLLVFFALTSPEKKKSKWLSPALTFILPLLLSFFIGSRYQEKGELAEVVVVQPNVDPYKEKFEGGEGYIPFEQQFARLITLSEQQITPNTKFVLWPETSISNGINWEENFGLSPVSYALRDFLNRHPGVELVSGITSARLYPDSTKRSSTARFHEQIGYYDVYNAGLHFKPSGQHEFYHKSKLVPGVEKTPYPGVFKALKMFAIDLGGIAGNMGTQETRAIFQHSQDPKLVGAPVVCYESIYGEYVSEYVRNGASAIFIITNDAWWSDSPGYKQHLAYASLRAIETRRAVARSANTGISGFIDQKGELLQRSGWWVPAAMRGQIRFNQEQTFYTRHGELIGHGTQWLALGLVVLAVVLRFTRRTPKNVINTHSAQRTHT
ncbi:apolipoprotein N-acyltransferase [Rufibacter roseolus]|uniref:apolipoprotein N-acyltransferase n=1 Tax=Rufibacter roseolus TaxID=2817375 RepID=UPI001B312CA5|nr:apolipoprotein N-acyltransferase [Rufibacter roseolus]